MDPAIVTRTLDPRQRTHFLVELGTPPPAAMGPNDRRWTQWPGPLNTIEDVGEVLAGVTYTYKDFEVGVVQQRGDGSGRKSLTITIPNGDNDVSDIATNLAFRGMLIRVKKVHSSEDWSVAGTETAYFAGILARPMFRGEQVTLVCNAFSGRSGPSPKTVMAEALITHAPPAKEIEF
jgi:hypothetical protein